MQEAAGLQDELRRAGIEPYGWIVNATLSGSGTRDPLLERRAALEQPYLRRVRDDLSSRVWRVPWRVTTDTPPRAASQRPRIPALPTNQADLERIKQ